MASVVYTLGIAHPPGYPLYILIGKIFINLIPFGNIAFRLNVFSALCSSITVYLIAMIFSKIINSEKFVFNKYSITKTNFYIVSYFPALLLAFSYLQWYLSLVSEMYTFNTFFTVLIFYLIFIKLEKFNIKTELNTIEKIISIKHYYLCSFLFGIGLGNRLDLILLLPGFVYLIWIKRKVLSSYNLITIFFFFLLGLSIYLYLPVRSIQNPSIDWGHPDSINKLYSTVTRKSHGGTLDLLSKNYTAGENFLPDIIFYLKHLFYGFAYLGIPIGILGIYFLFKTDTKLLVFTLLGFLISSIWFIYKANMPPNPHSLAVLEAHFILPNIIFLLWIGFGTIMIFSLLNKIGKSLYIPFIMLLVIMILINFMKGLTFLNKRTNYFSYDYIKNIKHSVNPGSIIIMKKDVQLFSMWYSNYVDMDSRNIIIAQGLSGSTWYQNMIRREHPEIFIGLLNDEVSWLIFINENNGKKIFYTGEVEITELKNYYSLPYGLVSLISKDKNFNSSIWSEILLNNIYIYRGNYNYYAYKEFFTPDLIDDYAKSRHRLGNYYLHNSNYKLAEKEFFHSMIYKREFPASAFHLGYTYFIQNKFIDALKTYNYAAKLYMDTLKLAQEYRSLPDVVNGIKLELAELYLHLGVTSEKLNREQDALLYYTKSIEYNPRFAEAYFNRSVIYWNRKDWKNVIKELMKVLEIKPDHNDAKIYLQKAKKMLDTNE